MPAYYVHFTLLCKTFYNEIIVLHVLIGMHFLYVVIAVSDNYIAMYIITYDNLNTVSLYTCTIRLYEHSNRTFTIDIIYASILCMWLYTYILTKYDLSICYSAMITQ